MRIGGHMTVISELRNGKSTESLGQGGKSDFMVSLGTA